MIKRILAVLLAAVLACALPVLPVAAAGGPTLRTTLTDGVQRGSKKTFDVWARNAGGSKIRATVLHNGERLEPTWEDDEKASYTLLFGEAGEHLVTVSAFSDGGKRAELTYHIQYQPAAEGEEIGSAVWSVELFTLGGGYLIEPTEVPIYEGETAAEQLLRLLSENGLTGYYGGTVKASFYLAYLADGASAAESYNGYRRSDPPKGEPRRLGLTPAIPALLVPFLEANMTYFDPADSTAERDGCLGEFAFTNGSGWMYAVNNVFPNVGFADCYPSDGDVVRVQFTLGYGADIGGAASVGSNAGNWFATADKDRLTVALCRARQSALPENATVQAAYAAALEAAKTPDAAQETVDAAAGALLAALENAGTEPPAPDTLPAPDTDAADAEPVALGWQIIVIPAVCLIVLGVAIGVPAALRRKRK